MLVRSTWYIRIIAATALLWNPGADADDASAAPSAPAPVCESAEYRQFDFWIGTWKVTEGGQPAGQNAIEPDLKHCALFESWRSISGSRGRSINFYDRDRRQWHQTWIDDSGGALELDGGLVGGSMVLEGERPDAKGASPIRHRITWTPERDGSVRQQWQTIKPAQSKWETVFDGIYNRAR
jgi:hypothetical protein